jgi:glycosyltransferase involved in cell wall biosynthesis
MRVCNGGYVFSAMLEVPISDLSFRAAPEFDTAEKPGPAARILIVLHDFSGGGTERVAIRLANQWARMGRAVRIFCGTEAGPLRGLVDPAIVVEQADPVLRRGTFSRVRLGFALAAAAARFRADAVFAPGNFHFLAMAAFGLRDRSGAATLCKISNPLMRRDRRGPSGWLRRRVMRLLAGRIDCLVAMSPALRAEAAAMIHPDRVAARWEPLIPAAAAISGPRPERDPSLIVAAGRLEPQKNFALAIEAMAHLSRWTDARLVILGEGSERAHLTQLIDRLGLHGRVMLHGHVPDITPWLQRASCYLMTSRYEGYPASLVEALANNVPTVVTPCSPALSEILPQDSLGAVSVADAGAIAAALQAVLRRQRPQPVDPMLLARHDEERAAASYLDLIDRCVGQTVR